MAASRGCIWGPLPDPLKWTRVLTLQPGSSDSVVALSLHQIEISKKQSYECVSYTWSSDSTTRKVTIDGKAHGIRENLWHCLHILREQCQHIPLWVDAISINQNDVVEKSQQVSIIGTIFRAAGTTRVWLGEAADDSDAVMDAMTRGCESTFIMHADKNHTGQTSRRQPQSLANAVDLQSRSRDKAPNYKSWRAMLIRPYWRRTWIIQELMLSKNLLIHCGKRRVSWERFHLYCSEVIEHLTTDSADHVVRHTASLLAL